MADSFTTPTPGEVLWVAAHFWWETGSVLLIREKAHARARQQYEAWSLNDGDGDAFRHAFASALLCRRFGEKEAKFLTDTHENTLLDDNPADSKDMDLHNNAVGREIYQEEKAKLTGDEEPDDYALVTAIDKAIKEGRMKILKHKP